jgi:crotonobetainyl-CoA:carnitine CoA-transferase CaiB-like acyl-CoA transferase
MIIRVPEPALEDELVPMPGVVPKPSGTPGRVDRGGPLLGEHNEEIWGKVVGRDELRKLVDADVI